MSEEHLSEAPLELKQEPLSEQTKSPAPADTEIIRNESDKAPSRKGAVIRGEFFAGPLPPPHYFKQYEEILPGAADRILRMAEEEGRHRRTIETYVIRHETYLQYLGLAAGWVIAILALILGYMLILNDKDGYGFFLILSTLSGVAGTWIYRARMEGKEKKQESSRAEK